MKYKTKKILYQILSLILAVFLVFTSVMYLFVACGSSRASAATLNDQLSSAQKMQSKIEQQLKDEQNEAKKIEKGIREIETKISDVNKNITNLETQIQEKTMQIAESEATINERFDAYKAVITAIYENGEKTNDNIILHSEDMVDFTYKSVLLNQILTEKKNIIETLETEQAKLEQAKEGIVEDKTQVQTQKNALASSKLELDAQKSKQSAVIADLRKKENEIQRQMDKLVAQLSAQSSTGTGSYSGTILWPAPGYTRITSPFGPRSSPGGIGSTYHKGIDIGAPSGATVVAAAAGKVIKAGWGGGYGNMVMIDHGNGFSTLYGHASRLVVSSGQTVSRGEKIMEVGSTGNSTGPHLHFETIRNGVSVNPFGNYFK